MPYEIQNVVYCSKCHTPIERVFTDTSDENPAGWDYEDFCKCSEVLK